MLSRLSIALRLLLLILVPVAALVIVAMSALASIQASANATAAFERESSGVLQLERLGREVQAGLLQPVAEFAAGMISPNEAAERLGQAQTQVEQQFSTVEPVFESIDAEQRQNLFDDRIALELAFGRAIDYVEDSRPAMTDPMMPNSSEPSLLALPEPQWIAAISQIIDRVDTARTQVQANADRIRSLSEARDAQFMGINAGLAVFGLLMALTLGYFIARSITTPVQRMTYVVGRVAGGDFSSRVQLSGQDEIAQLGNALDRLLNDRVATLARTEQENEQLNESVIALLRTVSRLSKRDLTVRVTVTEDVTGPVADAINQLTQETNRVLLEVAGIAEQVATAAALVNQKATFVNELADSQGAEAATTSEQLDTAAQRLAEIADVARQCDALSNRTTEMTESAVESVNQTLNGMTSIREIIQETGKRIKRLGERSQEISGVVELINQITERTTVLALNASMQAAAAGEAGRGFAVVADEVQRLAESSRNATAQIATLVKSIQVETNDTISTMDETINQVIAGSKLAEGAGRQMTDTQASTVELVAAVLRIASSSQEQAALSVQLKDRAQQMLSQTAETRRELGDQLEQTNGMVASGPATSRP
ncbi:MAG: methyl-accepting chemotaxis protein [Xanthomonadaceae bacterium]|nr:methyl-accepting chemotaxis protein [Xanthomonadaceae bacterium]